MRTSAMKGLWLKIGLLVLSVVIALLASEVGLRVAGMYEPPSADPVPRYPEMYQAHPVLGYTMIPSLRTTQRYPPSSTRELSIVSNSDGFRSPRELDEPDSRLRIWTLGDSFVEGAGVEVGDRFTEVIERLEPGWRVDTVGVGGWGLDLMVRAFEHLSTRVRPDVVLLAFYTDDFRRLQPFYAGTGYPIPKFVLDGDQLVSVAFPTVPAWRRLRIGEALAQRYWRTRRNRFDLNGALMDRLLEASRPESKLVVTFLPGKGDTDEDRLRRGWLREWCESTKTPFVDLTDVIHGAGVDLMYLEDNPHWNEAGHRVAGETLHGFLRAQVGPDGPSRP